MPQTLAQLAPFSPADERQIADVISCLGDPDHTLASIAQRHNTSLHALTQWMARPEIAARLDAFEGAFARAVRLQVADHLPAVASALVEVVRDAQEELAHIPQNPHSVRHLEQRTRARESCRKTGLLLIRLARFTGGPAPAPRPKPTLPAPTPTPPTDSSTASHPQPTWQPPQHPTPREKPTLDEVLAELRSLGFIIQHPKHHHAGDEAPPQAPPPPPPPPLNNTPSPDPNPPAEDDDTPDDPRIVLTIDATSRPAPNSVPRGNPTRQHPASDRPRDPRTNHRPSGPRPPPNNSS